MRYKKLRKELKGKYSTKRFLKLQKIKVKGIKDKGITE